MGTPTGGSIPPVTAEGATAWAAGFADAVLFPSAMATDAADLVPSDHLDRLAEAGLYGLVGPAEYGGLGLEGAWARAVVEALAGGCLATTFVWVQHHRLVQALAAGDAPAILRDEWLGPLCRGEVRAGVALGGLLPQPATLRAEPAGDGWVLHGNSPWVTGWGLVDVLLVAARADDQLVWLALDATGVQGIEAERQRLMAVDASATVRLTFDGVEVPAERVVKVEPVEASPPALVRTNGALALGVAGRCCRLLGPGPLDDQLIAARAALDGAADQLPEARAGASALALQAAAALVVHLGSRSVGRGEHSQRLAREAAFLLVFGSRPAIRAALLDRFVRGDGFEGGATV